MRKIFTIMKGLGDSNAERNAHKDENIAAISLTYNYKEFIMKKIISLFLLSVCVALSACSMTPENPSETSEIFSGLNEDLEEKPLEVLYHGGNPLTPEDTLSKVLIETSEKVPVCPTCKAEMRATLTNSEKLPVQEQSCLSMAQGTDGVYNFLLSYEWKCPSCGYTEGAYTSEGTYAIICHGWNS